ncbi:MAG: hypothetical protein HC927_06915 [Deltaproteobacteria bacterium]|nr:hypothetical protein [Deltaproteobacteria bacterium]
MAEDSRDFERALAILRGARTGNLDDVVAAKVRVFVMHDRGADTWIRPTGITVRFVGNIQVHRYVLSAAPAIAWDLLGGMDLAAIHGPTLGVYRRSRGRLSSYFGYGEGDHVVWVEPHDELIQLSMRLLIGEGPVTGPIPSEGPWSRPDPPRPPERGPLVLEHVELFPDRACPRCGRVGQRFRKLHDGALVCPSCGCSFDP